MSPPMIMDEAVEPSERAPGWARAVVACAGVVGLVLTAQAALASSATYDEVAYLRIASGWWRTGHAAEITRMGSPLTFFKLQHAPAFFVLDRIGLGGLVDRPIVDQASLLPIVRIGSLWIWLAAFGLTAYWSLRIYGPRAMAFAACLFALSPNLLAHGSIATMEMPLIAASAALFLLFWKFLETDRWEFFYASAAVGGLAFSCKFTTVLYPPILGLIWAVDLWRRGIHSGFRIVRTVGLGMMGYGLILLAANLVVTGFALIPPSARRGDHPSAPGLAWLLERPMPQDWVGFATQIRHQRNGGPSYLLGERRMTGWWYYYPVALAVKVPIGCLLLLMARGLIDLRRVRCADVFDRRPGQDVRTADPTNAHGGIAERSRRDWILPLTIAAFIALAMVGSKRNYGVRYLLPMAPLAIVWASALAERRGFWRWIVGLVLIGQGTAVTSIHPHELSYFNILAGGKIGGRRILADSNLDWGQGLRCLATLQKEYQPLTLFYFGDTDPARSGIDADCILVSADGRPWPLPRNSSRSPAGIGPRPVEPAEEIGWSSPGIFGGVLEGFDEILRNHSRFVAVSASLQHGPWGPVYLFQCLDGLTPVAYTHDGTIAIYDVAGSRICELLIHKAVLTFLSSEAQ